MHILLFDTSEGVSSVEMQKQISESLKGLKDPQTGQDISAQLKDLEVNENGCVKIIINTSGQNTNYASLENEIAQRVLAFEGIGEVQVEFH